MNTMNNTTNNIIRPAYIPLRTILQNGDGWDLHMDITPLDDEEIAPAVEYLLTGELDEHFRTQKMYAYIAGVYEHCVEALMNFCFEYGCYDHCYTIDLILREMESQWCCESCCTREIQCLEQLYQEYLEGSVTAEDEIETRVKNFFAKTCPFTFEML